MFHTRCERRPAGRWQVFVGFAVFLQILTETPPKGLWAYGPAGAWPHCLVLTGSSGQGRLRQVALVGQAEAK